MKWREASPQLLAKYPQLPAILIGQTETFIWRIVKVLVTYKYMHDLRLLIWISLG